MTPNPIQLPPTNAWMYDRHAGPVRTAVGPEDLAAWPARPADGRSQGERVREQAQKWVAQTFFGTLLKQMRNSPFKSDVFSGGRGGEAFNGLLDQHLADRMARGAGRRLAESIAKHLDRGRGRHQGLSAEPGPRSDNSIRDGDAPAGPTREGDAPAAPRLREGDAPAEPRLGGSLALPGGAVHMRMTSTE